MKKTLKKEKLNIRVCEEEKVRLKRNAKRINMSVSDYVRVKLFAPSKEGKDCKLLIGIMLVKVQEIVNYIQEKYGKNDELKEMVEELWGSIQS